ncbi:RecA-superfamily ATPase implicated in signal transduction [Halanaeroarchaeum sp. HSR-CO]|uniref:KaiC domain-containing protein n=1 Tax=Halanaeroarchaeum sp. HSR-CO TaxID=2866382 RepID=UPI00217F1631|nr:KaiC domain-containing protein [Halanaeroarchaeum sp. HSR-CO]UWG48823.1 RecA-superfamily ATPase implicated in signal transduction [Halanaeroarchaeum sp. HSR-CO]
MADRDQETDGRDEDDDWFERALQADDDEVGEEDEPRDAGPTSVDEQPAASNVEPAERDTASRDVDDGSDDFGFDTGLDDPQGDIGTDFAEAFDDSSPGGGPGGFDPGGGDGESFGFDLGGSTGATEDFDDEDFESALPRIELGIEGLDEMIQGGVPERTLLVAIGGAGTGKTTFGLQFLEQALSAGDRGVYITLEESHERVLQSAEEKGWEFERYEADGDLAVIDLDPVEMANSLTSIRNELPRLVESFGASRLVLDSVSLLEMMYDDQATRRTEIYDFARALKNAGVTTMLTSEADTDNPFASRYGIIEYLTDAVFVLRHVRPEDFRETRLAIEIQKIRDANHSRETKPYEITDTGISVYRQANIF